MSMVVYFLEDAHLGDHTAAVRHIGRLFPAFGASVSVMRFTSISTRNSRCNILTQGTKDLICNPEYEVKPELRQCCSKLYYTYIFFKRRGCSILVQFYYVFFSELCQLYKSQWTELFSARTLLDLDLESGYRCRDIQNPWNRTRSLLSLPHGPLLPIPPYCYRVRSPQADRSLHFQIQQFLLSRKAGRCGRYQGE